MGPSALNEGRLANTPLGGVLKSLLPAILSLFAFLHIRLVFGDLMLFFSHYHAEAIDASTRTGCTDANKLELLSTIAFKYTTIVPAFERL